MTQSTNKKGKIEKMATKKNAESGTYAIDLQLPHMQKLEKVKSSLPPASERVEKAYEQLLAGLDSNEIDSLAERLKFAYRVSRTVEAVERDSAVEKGGYVKVMSGAHTGEFGVVVEKGRIRCRVEIPGVGKVYLFTSECQPLTAKQVSKFERELRKVG